MGEGHRTYYERAAEDGHTAHGGESQEFVGLGFDTATSADTRGMGKSMMRIGTGATKTSEFDLENDAENIDNYGDTVELLDFADLGGEDDHEDEDGLAVRDTPLDSNEDSGASSEDLELDKEIDEVKQSGAHEQLLSQGDHNEAVPLLAQQSPGDYGALATPDTADSDARQVQLQKQQQR